MSSFQGFCSFPHGGQTTGFLWVSLAAATICTCYSIASCRMVTLRFASALGNFDTHFTEFDAAATAQEYQVGIGLFVWLRPSFYVDGDDDTVTRAQVGNWREGTCVGYNTLQLEEIMDDWLEATRILGVFCVLISWSVFLFSLMVSCISIANWQRYLLTASCLFLAIINGLTLLMTNSELCTQMGTEPGTSVCEYDQGALVAIAAVILWVCSALLAFFFMEPLYAGARKKASSSGKRSSSRSRSSSRNRALDKQRKQNKVDWNNKGSNKKSTSKQKKKKESTTPTTIQSSFSMPSPKYAESSDSVQALRSIPKQSSKTPAVASKPIMQEDKLQRQTNTRSNQGFEEKKDPAGHRVPDDGDYDCIPLDVESRGLVPPSQRPAYRHRMGTNPVKDYVQEVTRSQSQLSQPERKQPQRGSTAGEILIDLRSADNSKSKQQSRSQQQQQQPRTIPKTKSSEGSVLEEIQRQIFFTDLDDANSRASTSPNSRKQKLQKALDEDLALQQSSRSPFAVCDPGCWH